jgi:hypothetical protein
MVINLRGTGGSGKSTVIRRIMEHYPSKNPQFIAGRKQPIGYQLHGLANTSMLYIPGHYETACGGCDTITAPDHVYDLVYRAVDRGENVAYEGIIIGDDVTRAVDLARHVGKENFSVIALNTPMDVCLASIQARRDARGDTRPLNKTNTISRNERLKRIMSRLKDATIDAKWMSREEAYTTACKALGIM